MDIHEYTLNLLEECGCNKTAYEGQTVEQATEDMKWYENEHGKCHFPIEQIAEELVRIGNHGLLAPPPMLEDFAGNGDACHWGFSDMYPECEAKLRELIDRKEPFDTGWCGCKKEIISFRIISYGNEMFVETYEEIDEMPELIADALDNGDELTEEQIAEIQEYWDESWELTTETSNENTIQVTTYEDLIAELERQGNENSKFLDGCFETLKDIIKYVKSK